MKLVEPQSQLEERTHPDHIFTEPSYSNGYKLFDDNGLEFNKTSAQMPNNLSANVKNVHKPFAKQTSNPDNSLEIIEQVQPKDMIVKQAPQFNRPLRNIETVELTNVHLECRLEPMGDTAMKVDWLVNGRPIRTGHRFRPSHDFNYAGLDILGVYPEDSGVYTCQARNQFGEAATSCTVKVQGDLDLVLESQHPQSLQQIRYLENIPRYNRPDVHDEFVNVKPKFTSVLKTQENLNEGQNAHLECKLEPVTDSNLKVEWYKDNEPITIGTLMITPDTACIIQFQFYTKNLFFFFRTSIPSNARFWLRCSRNCKCDSRRLWFIHM